MSTTVNTTDLCARIKAVIQEYIAASREAAMRALKRAFSSDPPPSPTSAHRRRTPSPATYRSRETLVALQGAIYECLKTSSGAGAPELSAQLAITVKEA